jgi:peptidoglycan hydrolase-like protein with peptidoglycan-binding domain
MRKSAMLAAALFSAVLIPSAVRAESQLVYVQPVPQQSVQAIQQRLRQDGVYSGSVDGVWGPDSRAALERYQQNHQLQVTGQVNQATIATMGLDPGTFLTQQTATEPPSASQLRPASVQAIQSHLRSMGFYNGAVDGVWGAATQTAIERFQQGRGLQPNGQLNPATVSAMGLAPDALAYR